MSKFLILINKNRNFKLQKPILLDFKNVQLKKTKLNNHCNLLQPKLKQGLKIKKKTGTKNWFKELFNCPMHIIIKFIIKSINCHSQSSKIKITYCNLNKYQNF